MHQTNVHWGGRLSALARGLAATVALSLPLTLGGLTLAPPVQALAARVAKQSVAAAGLDGVAAR